MENQGRIYKIDEQAEADEFEEALRIVREKKLKNVHVKKDIIEVEQIEQPDYYEQSKAEYNKALKLIQELKELEKA